MSLYSRLDRLAADVAKLDRKVDSVSNSPQAQRTSIEAGTMDVNDEDGNLISTIGLQEDGSGATRFFDGPIPPVPAGFTALADGPLIQGTWDGSFEDGQQATYDLAYLEVAATLINDDSRVSFATITAKEGASASVVANQSGLWAVAVRSVSQAGKKSEFASAGTVEVKLVDLAGAIEAVQDSANGKNKVNYSDRPPTPSDPGIFDDTWFVGQVGRPNDVVEATNLFTDPALKSVGGWSTADSIEAVTFWTGWTENQLPQGLMQKQVSGSVHAESAVVGAVSPGDIVTLGMGFSTNPDCGVSLRIYWYNDSGYMSNTATQSSGRGLGKFDRITVTGAAPEGAKNFRVSVWMTGSVGAASILYMEALTVEWGTTSGTYFDGDTPSGVTDNESHYRWTGTPHASTSEKYLPALDIGDSDNWNVIEQYRHDGTGWVKVELSHYVFSTVDLGKATVGELDGIRIMAKTIGTEQLRADFADFMVARGATLIAGNDRHRLDDSGYAIFDDNGDRRTFLSPEGSTFKGEVEADTLVVNGGAELRGTDNTLAQGAKLTLAAGVTDPTAPPTVQPFWDGMEFEPVFMNGSSPVGLAWDGTNYITVGGNKAPSGVSSFYRGVYAAKINGTTGVSSQLRCDFSAGADNEQRVSEVFGVTCIGSELFWLGRYGYVGYVWVTDLNGAFKRRFPFEDMGYATDNPLKYKPGIGTDGTNVIIAHCSDAGALYVRKYNKTTGAKTDTITASDVPASDFTGVYVGPGDFGSNHVVCARASNRSFIRYDMSGNRVALGGWLTAENGDDTGVVFRDGKFRSLSPSGVVNTYEPDGMGDESGDWWAVYRWVADTTPEDPNITHWSRISPPKRFTWPRRAKIKILGQPLPQGVDFIGPSIAKKTSMPVRTDFHSPTWQIRSGESVAWWDEFPANWESASTPQDQNNFPNAEKAVIESASATFRVEGDGSGRWGPLTFNTDGSLSGIPKMAVGKGETVTVPSGSAFNTKTVTFPQGRFTTPPTVVVSADTTSEALVNVGALTVTKDGFTLSVRRTNSTPTGVDWIAMEVN